MKEVSEDTYLGDLVRADGRNSSNIRQRVSKGLGIISQIMRILETISFGKSYFQIAFSLREAKFINGILTNVEIWYGLSKAELEELEIVDRLLMRRIFSLPISTCTEALYLESGCLDISTIIKGRRAKYLHYLVNTEDESMLSKFFKTQWDFPARGDWVIQCKQDLNDFNLPEQFDFYKGKSQEAFKVLIDKKCKEFAFDKFCNLKVSHSKLDNLNYYELKLQTYLRLSELSVEESKALLLWRLRMAQFARNFGEKGKLCPLCLEHEDTQENSFKCKEIRKHVKLEEKYSDIFRNPGKGLVRGLMKIMKVRQAQT